MITSANWGWAGRGAGRRDAELRGRRADADGLRAREAPARPDRAGQFAGSFVKLVAPAAVAASPSTPATCRSAASGRARRWPAWEPPSSSAWPATSCCCCCSATSPAPSAATSLTPSRTLVITLLAAAVLIVVIMRHPAGCAALITTRLRPLFSGVIPRMLDVLQSPERSSRARRHPAADALLCGLPRRLRPRLRRFPELRRRRHRLPRGQRHRLGRPHPRRPRRGRGRPLARPDARRASPTRSPPRRCCCSGC